MGQLLGRLFPHTATVIVPGTSVLEQTFTILHLSWVDRIA